MAVAFSAATFLIARRYKSDGIARLAADFSASGGRKKS